MRRCRSGRPVGKRQNMPPEKAPSLNSKRHVAGGKRRKVGKWQQQLEAGRQSAIAAAGSLIRRRCRAWCSGSHLPRPAGLLRRIRTMQSVRGGLVSAGCFFLSTAPGVPPSWETCRQRCTFPRSHHPRRAHRCRPRVPHPASPQQRWRLTGRAEPLSAVANS